MKLNRLNTTDPDFDRALQALLRYEPSTQQEVEQRVADIVQQVRRDGDAALLTLTAELDGWSPGSAAEFAVSPQRLQQAYESLPAAQRSALDIAAKRVEVYHQHQRQASWEYQDELGNTLGQRVTALQRVGVYVPGGKASYPSTVLMNVIPAKVAGVEEVLVVAPANGGKLDDLVLAAAHCAGADAVLMLGGAQAVAALAYGTDSIQAVDKIVGPGNIYVATAKKQVAGHVGIDMVAGPSEVVIVADGSVSPAWIALDMFAQAEHDEMAQAILLCPNREYAVAVEQQMESLLPGMSRRAIIAESLASRGAIIEVESISAALALANRIAPEHLQLAIENAADHIEQIRHAGALFLGAHSPEAFGDYCAGPSHVLPTSGTARFASPLGVYDFQKRISVIACSEQGAHSLATITRELAEGEGLDAHALSASARAANRG